MVCTATRRRGGAGRVRALLHRLLPASLLRRALHHRGRCVLLLVPAAHPRVAHAQSRTAAALDAARARGSSAALDGAGRRRLSAPVGLALPSWALGGTNSP